MTEEHETGEFGLVMPFVLVASHGGPYDDSAYVAGWRLGALDVTMQLAAAMGLAVPDQMLYPSDHPQVDLLAMRHGFTWTAESTSVEGWARYSFKRVRG